MVYNNGFPMNYQQFYPQTTQPQMVPMQPQPQSNIDWVQGIEGAKAHHMGPNTTLPLWDSESQTIYVKSTNAVGIPTITILDYTIRENTPKGTSESKGEWATQEDINSLRKEIEGIKAHFKPMINKEEHDV